MGSHEGPLGTLGNPWGAMGVMKNYPQGPGVVKDPACTDMIILEIRNGESAKLLFADSHPVVPRGAHP